MNFYVTDSFMTLVSIVSSLLCINTIYQLSDGKGIQSGKNLLQKFTVRGQTWTNCGKIEEFNSN